MANLFVVRSAPIVFRLKPIQSLMTSPMCAEKALEHLKKNSYYEKYADKIARLQQTAPEEFSSKVEVLEKKKVPKKKPGSEIIEGKFSQLLNPKKPLESSEDSSETSLAKVLKLDLIKDKTAEEIAEIWRRYHLQKNFIAAVIPDEEYTQLEKRSEKHPTFLFPLPRDQGYEFIMCQFDKNCVHFTPLLYYQVHKENAPECLTITHYTELRDDQKIILMRGEYDKTVIGLKEALCLANELKMYYVNPTEEREKLLEIFTNRPLEFKHMDLVKQIENLSL